MASSLQLSLINQPLSQRTTFCCGGVSLGIIDCQTPEDVCLAVFELQSKELPFIVIGGGSNIIVSDSGLTCYVISYYSQEPIIKMDGDLLNVSAGSVLDQVVQYAAEQGLAGINFASGIPGTVGGAVVGNAGAFGQQISDALHSFEVLNRYGEKRVVLVKDGGFSYRHSALKSSSDIVLSVCLKLKKADSKKLINDRNDILKVRKEKHPDWRELPCAGSIFRNIESKDFQEKRQAAGHFLELAGVKSFYCGGASVFKQHANIIVGSSSCCAQDVFDLVQEMKTAVMTKFGFELIREVRFIGHFSGSQHAGNNHFF